MDKNCVLRTTLYGVFALHLSQHHSHLQPLKRHAFPDHSKDNMNSPAPLNDPADATADPQPAASPEAESPVEQPKICLDQFLKTCGVETGGQAKRLIQGGEVLVNNEVETRRRRKLVPGDEVQLYEDIFVVALAEPDETDAIESE